MNPSKRNLLQALLASAVCALSTVVAGGGGETGTGGGRMTSYARITDFGSIWVNGVEFFTQTATITINNVPGQPESALKAGMVVKVSGDLALDGLSGVATQVVHDTDLRGTLDTSPQAIADGFALSVHGLAVHTDGRTIVSGAAGAGLLSAGQRIVVSGLRDETTNSLRATRIDVLAANATGSILRGRASSASGTQFVLGSTTIDATNATLHEVSLAEIAAGAEIRVRATANVTGNALVAQSIERAEYLVGWLTVGLAAEIEGLATSVSVSGFQLNGITVSLSPTTTFVNGTLADLVNGVNVEVKGTADTTASLTANTVKFSVPEPIDAEGVVVAVSGNALTLFSSGNGATFSLDQATQWKDASRAKLANFSLDHLSVGDRVRVRGNVLKTSTLATRVERTRPDTGFDLKTRVFEATFSTPSGALVLDNTIVSTNAATNFFDATGQPMSAAAFYQRAIGLRLHVRGLIQGNALIATSAEIQK